jgi:hypothetical protein
MAVDLLQRHLQTLVADPEQWQTLIADDIVWELAYAPALGHPARLSGRGEVMRHVAWFLGAVENFRFFDARYYARRFSASTRDGEWHLGAHVASRILPVPFVDSQGPGYLATLPHGRLHHSCRQRQQYSLG